MGCNNQAWKLYVCIAVAKLESDKKGQFSGALQTEGDILAATTEDNEMQQKSPENIFLMWTEATASGVVT